jgi:hypothetical protein
MPLLFVDRKSKGDSAMHLRTGLATTLALLATFGAAMAALAPSARSAQADDDLRALSGEWLYVEDRTEGRASEDQQPPMSVTFGFRVEEDAVVMLRGKGTNRREERIALDGSTTEEVDGDTARSSRGEWKDGVLEYEITAVRVSDSALLYLIRREFRITPDGLLVRVVFGDPVEADQLAFYRHPQDIELRTPAPSKIADMAWLTGAWVGTTGSSSTEERWSPPLGGAMLGVSRTVKGGSMVAFEYLRIVERNGGLVYFAQPGGAPPTEFVLTDLGPTAAVFENPRHDSPQRIVYELSAEGSLSASIGFINGGRPHRFEFTREGD